ncbi:MAG TPA: hypothetical protein VGV87_19685 [Blastocatellia bacterium]|nr:hypothetical protein [Blastocatellia bacterium]
MMKARLALAVFLLLSGSQAASAQKHEGAFLAGGLKTGEHGFVLPRPGFIRTGAGLTYQLNYSSRFFDGKAALLYFEFPLVVTPTRDLNASNVALPSSYSSLFFTPGIKLKLLPGLKWSPYAFAGVGVARLTASDTQTDGLPNIADRTKIRGAYDFGGGVDVKVFPHLSLRGEVRDFYSGTPSLNVTQLKSWQHNYMVSAGLVVRF